MGESLSLMRSKQKTWILVRVPKLQGASEMLTVGRGEFILLAEGLEDNGEDPSSIRWRRAWHPNRGECKIIDDHWEEWTEDAVRKD